MNIHYDPEKFGLTVIGGVEWSDGAYEFDLTMVWRRDMDGRLFYGEDSGCSCPIPFEGQGIGDLTACTVQSLSEHLAARNASRADYEADRADRIADLMGKLVTS